MEPQVKRQKRGDGAPPSGAGGSRPSAVPPDRHDGCAFSLTRLKSAPASHNVGAMGIQDLLEGDFSRCLLTNYMYDLPWLVGECPRLASVPVVLVHGERDRQSIDQECDPFENITPVAPPLPIAYGTHHTKMMVVVYPDKVRVAIFTANFISIDWDNKTQGVWHQDFGLKVIEDSSDEEKESSLPSAEKKSGQQPDFETDLVDYLSSLGAPVVAFCRELGRFDFSKASVALVPSIPGYHKGKDMDKYGHLRVRRLLKDLKVSPSDHPLICQFSSLGSLDEKWLFGEFAASFLPGKKISASSAPIQALHIIWPSVNDVRNSIEGWNAGRAVPCPLKNMKPFLHKYLRKWTPPAVLHRQNAMPHIKTYARFDPDQSNYGKLDWAILTSSNLSKAAWGALQKNESQLMIRSYELGVMFLPTDISGGDDPKRELCVAGSSAAAKEEESARLVLPLLYAFPITTYDPKKDEPWVWDIIREEPDIFGSCYFPH